jgi:cytochrome P450
MKSLFSQHHAGSDTTATTLASVSHYLTGSSRCYRRATEEVRTTFASADEIHLGPKLNSCVFLRACIDEALRLSPPGGSALWREVDSGGASIGGEFFPQGTEIGVATYTIHHNPNYWDDAFSYTPERWLRLADEKATPTVTSRRRPLVPFSIGPRSCVGKPLAYAQTMLTLACMLWEFDMRRADSEEGWEAKDTTPTEYELKEHITAHKKGPVLCFRPRF